MRNIDNSKFSRSYDRIKTHLWRHEDPLGHIAGVVRGHTPQHSQKARNAFPEWGADPEFQDYMAEAVSRGYWCVVDEWGRAETVAFWAGRVTEGLNQSDKHGYLSELQRAWLGTVWHTKADAEAFVGTLKSNGWAVRRADECFNTDMANLG